MARSAPRRSDSTPAASTRVKAVVSIAGDKAFMPGTWVSSGTRPWLGIQGNADRALLRFGALADAGAFHLVADPPIR